MDSMNSPKSNTRDSLGEDRMAGMVIWLRNLQVMMVAQPSRSIITRTWGLSISHPMNHCTIKITNSEQSDRVSNIVKPLDKYSCSLVYDPAYRNHFM